VKEIKKMQRELRVFVSLYNWPKYFAFPIKPHSHFGGSGSECATLCCSSFGL